MCPALMYAYKSSDAHDGTQRSRFVRVLQPKFRAVAIAALSITIAPPSYFLLMVTTPTTRQLAGTERLKTEDCEGD